ncbi:MAG TPA: hypothetical protein VL463_03205 [Kofleriaceae bacterium]|nr:hypothetical protein [Kofleriaceae bacterium]
MLQEPKPGTRFAERFELRQVVAQTPAYVEYRAVDGEVGVECAVWWMKPGLVGDSARQEQWMGAGVELRRFSHASVRKLHAAGAAGGTAWASWQLATGRGPLPVKNAAVELASVTRWIDATCAGLAALHAIGIVHGHLLPDDVVFVAGELKLSGAGLIRLIEPTAALRAWQRQLGFVAPELRTGAAPTPSSDAWTVAAIAAGMIGGSDGADDAMRVVAKRHPPLYDLIAGVLSAPPDKRSVDLAAFARDARERAKMPYLADDRTGPMRALKPGMLAAAGPPAGKPKPARSKGPTAPVGSGITTASHDDPTVIDPKQPAHDEPTATAQTKPSQPTTFGLPTPQVAPPAPVQQRPAVAIGPEGYPTPMPEPPPRAPTPDPRAEPPAKLKRAITAPVGGFQVMSMKPAAPQAQQAPGAEAAGKSGSGRVKKAKVRMISEAQKRSFSTKPGALGYLAPPREVAEAQKRAARQRLILILVVVVVGLGAAIGGYLIARG